MKTICNNRPRIIICLLIVSILFVCCAQYNQSEGAEFKKYPYVQNVTTTSAVIMWETETPGKGMLKVEDKQMPYPEASLHEIGITGLKPDTEYAYSLDGVSIGKFRTFPAHRNAHVNFVVYGDTRTTFEDHAAVGKAIKKTRPLFVINSGDYVTNGNVEDQWGEQYFTPIRDLIKNVPVFTAVGNHERTSLLYHVFFSQPGNERYYSFDAGCVHIIILDSMIRDLEGIRKQAEWLEKDLKSNTAAWTFAVLHHLPLTKRAAGLSMIEINEYVPLLFKYGVHFVFAGHDHYYKRTEPFIMGKNAITFIVSAGGGAPLRKMKEKEKEEWDVVADSIHHFCHIKASSDAITIEAIDIQGNKIDTFNLKKSELDSYAKKGRKFKDIIQDLRNLLKNIYLDDYDEINETMEIEFDLEPKPGKKGKCTMKALSNPFDKPMHFIFTWDTEGSSWKVSPNTMEMSVHPGKSAVIAFTAQIGDPIDPVHKIKYEITFGGEKKGEGTIWLPVGKDREEEEHH